MARSARAPARRTDGHVRAADATVEAAAATAEAAPAAVETAAAGEAELEQSPAAAVQAAPAAVEAEPAALEAELEQTGPAASATAPEPAAPASLAGISAGARPVVGLVLILNGKPLTIDADQIAKWRTEGFHYENSKPIDLGTYVDVAKKINDAFHVSLPVEASTFQPPFDQIAQNVSLTIQDAHLHIPGAQAADKTITYKLVVSVDAKAGVAVGGYGLKGLSFGMTNETGEKPKALAS